MAKKTLTLKERPCKLGPKIGGGSKGEGEELTRIAEVPITGVMLNQVELDKLLGEGSHARLFTKRATEAVEPFFADVPHIPFSHRFLDSQVTLEVDGESMTLTNVKIHKLALQPQVGGMTHADFAILVSLDDHPDVCDLQLHTSTDIRAQFGFGTKASADKRQKELALDHKPTDEDEQDELVDAKPKKGNGRQPAAH